MSTAAERLVLAGGLAYLALLSWAIGSLSFDIWGALVLIPIYGIAGIALARRMFAGRHTPLARIMCWGLLIKLGGAFARYWVGFEAYEGGIDAGQYHAFAVEKVDRLWDGDLGLLDLVPTGIGTQFVENFTALVYALTIGSQLAGFVSYSFLAYIGLMFTVKAAAIAVPDLAGVKYAWLCVVAPSIVYWPASIGKEAVMMLGLGIATFGVALLLTRHWLGGAVVTAAALGFAAVIRPHMAGIWVAATIPAMIVALVIGTERDDHRPRGRFGLLLIIVAAAAGVSLLASATIELLEPANEDLETTSFTELLEETTRRTAQAGSQFTPPPIDSPTDWPFAVVRTLTRPLPIEARGIAQLASAAEIAALFLLFAVSWRRVKALPRAVIRFPFLTFAITTLFLSGLAFSVFANLGVLTRQRSLVVPFLLLPACLPVLTRRQHRGTPMPGAQTGGIPTRWVEAPVR